MSSTFLNCPRWGQWEVLFGGIVRCPDCWTAVWSKLAPCHGVPWVQKISFPFMETAELSKVFSFKVWGRSEYSHAYFTYCQEFFLSNFCLPGSLSFVFPSPLQTLWYLTGAVNQAFACDLMVCVSSQFDLWCWLGMKYSQSDLMDLFWCKTSRFICSNWLTLWIMVVAGEKSRFVDPAPLWEIKICEPWSVMRNQDLWAQVCIEGSRYVNPGLWWEIKIYKPGSFVRDQDLWTQVCGEKSGFVM